MKRLRVGRAARLVLALVCGAGIAGAAVVANGSVAGATSTLQTVTLTVGNNAINAATSGSTNTATYTWRFTTGSVVTATELTSTKITVTVPAGTTLSSPAVTAYGVTCTTLGTPSLTGTTVTVTPATCTTDAASTPVEISISGIVNGTAAGSFTSSATFGGETGTAAAVSFGGNTTKVTVNVPESLSFSNSATTITLLPVPGAGQQTAAPVQLEVGTNADGGFTLEGCVTAANAIKDQTKTSDVIGQQASAVTSLSASATAFGAKPAVSGTGASLGTGWTSDKYLGYSTACSTAGHGVIMKATAPVTTATLTLTNAVSVKASQASGVYKGTITYQVTPSY